MKRFRAGVHRALAFELQFVRVILALSVDPASALRAFDDPPQTAPRHARGRRPRYV
jgi:hypothetical protein